MLSLWLNKGLTQRVGVLWSSGVMLLNVSRSLVRHWRGRRMIRDGSGVAHVMHISTDAAVVAQTALIAAYAPITITAGGTVSRQERSCTGRGKGFATARLGRLVPFNRSQLGLELARRRESRLANDGPHSSNQGDRRRDYDDDDQCSARENRAMQRSQTHIRII